MGKNARTFGQDLMRGEHTVGENGTGRLGESTFATPYNSNNCPDPVSRKILAAGRKRDGHRLKPGPSPEDWQNEGGQRPGSLWHGGSSESNAKVAEVTTSGTSIFDPVLCELVYRWFCPPAGLVLDPFAGGSVRGIVASKLGRPYVGIDLRPEQVAANQAQAIRLCTEPLPVWMVGDSRNLATLAAGIDADLVFSCPPYGDLEVYSDDEADLSTLDYPAFRDAYRGIVAAAVARLKPDRFACFVVGDIRDRNGFYRRFVSDTEQAFEDAGARLYNEAVLVTAVGSLPIRVGRQFEAARKLGKTHQNVLVFCNGDPRRATEAVGPVEFGVTLDEAGGGPASDPVNDAMLT